MTVHLDRVDQRAKVKVRRNAHWQRLTQGRYIGFRRMTASTAGTWLARFYDGAEYVRVVAPADNGKLEPEALNETNKLELYVFASEKHRQAVLVARLDNLGKGASGAAVQNLGLMLGL